MLSEISQRTANIVWSHLYVESKKNKVKVIEIVEWWLPWAGGWGNGEMPVKGYKPLVIR